jgi:hypothetical protein
MSKLEWGVTVGLGRTTIDTGWGDMAAVWGVWMLGVLLLPFWGLMVSLIGASGDEGFLFWEDAYNRGCDCVVGDCVVVFADNVDADFLLNDEWDYLGGIE